MYKLQGKDTYGFPPFLDITPCPRRVVLPFAPADSGESGWLLCTLAAPGQGANEALQATAKTRPRLSARVIRGNPQTGRGGLLMDLPRDVSDLTTIAELLTAGSTPTPTRRC